MKKHIIFTLILLLLFSFIACDNENAFRQEEAICRVGDRYFITIQDAINLVNSQSKEIDTKNTIYLVKDVTSKTIVESQRKGISINSDLSNDITINLAGFTYEFGSSSFITINSSANVNITNGELLISNSNKSEGNALEIKKGNVTLTDLVVIDNRNNPKVASLSSSSTLTINASQNDKTSLKGSFKLNNGAKILINSGSVSFTDINEPAGSISNIIIKGGNISNSHDLNDRITQAIPDGQAGINRVIVHGPIESHDAKKATCFEEGNIAYYICKNAECGKYFSDKECFHEIEPQSIVIDKLSHDMITIPEKKASCTESGNIEYYQCKICNNYYFDSNGTKVIDDLNTTLTDKLQHIIKHIDAQESTCTTKGHDEYYQCENCKKYYTNESGTTETSKPEFKELLPHTWSSSWTVNKEYHWIMCTVCEDVKEGTIANHDFGDWQLAEGSENSYQKVCKICNYKTDPITTCIFNDFDAKAATCTEKGNIAYSQCEIHKDYYKLDHTTKLTEEEIFTNALGHISDENGWHFDNTSHFYLCTRCSGRFSVNSHTLNCTSIDSLYHSEKCTDCNYEESKAEHTMTSWKVNNGIAERKCENCLYEDEIDISNANLTEVAYLEPTCTSNGNYQYFKCDQLGSDFVFNSDKSQVISIKETVISKKSHSLSKVEAKDATCGNAGNKEYWECSTCSSIFADSNGKTPIQLAEVTIPQLNHIWDTSTYKYDDNYHWYECLNGCGVKNIYNTHTLSQWTITTPKVKAQRKCNVCDFVIEATFEHVDAKAATTTEDGCLEHYYSKEHNLYMNADGTELVRKSEIIVSKNS